MGIIINALVISLGGILGGIFKSKVSIKSFDVLGIGVMIISVVGFLENIFTISDAAFKSESLILIVLCLLIGAFIGEHLHIESNLSRLTTAKNTSFNGIMDATLFFGIGGLQISGPILLAINGDSSQLLLKSAIDLPFALIFGATYGKSTGFSAIPVGLLQVVIFVAALLARSFFSPALIAELCALGYIILFFTGFNLISGKKYKINNTDMLPGIFVIILYHIITSIGGKIFS